LDPEDDNGVDLEFLSEAVKRFEEDESIKPAFIMAVEEMSKDLADMSINDDYKPYVTVCPDNPSSSYPSVLSTSFTGPTEPCPPRSGRCCDHRVVSVQRISRCCII
jgi:hypothetical protein